MIMTADIEGAMVEYVDIVIAYQLTVDWSEGKNLLRKVFFQEHIFYYYGCFLIRNISINQRV